MDWLITLCGGEGLCTVLDGVKLLYSVGLMVLRQDAGYCLVTGISFHDCLEVSVEFSEDGSGEESLSKFVEGLLLLISPSKGNIFGQVDQRSCLSTIIGDESTVGVSKA